MDAQLCLPPVTIHTSYPFFDRGTTSLAYGPLSECDFFAWDDAEYVLENRHVKKGFTSETIIRAFSNTDTGNWHPLTWLSLMANYTLYGSDPVGYHRTKSKGLGT